LLIIFLLVPVQPLDAAVQVSSGAVQLGNVLNYGTTAYSVGYSYPNTAEVGNNLTVALTLQVDSLSGTIEYISSYAIYVYVYVGAQIVGNGSAVSPLNSLHLYPGGSWGPINVTIPFTATGTGLAKGQSANATVSVILENQDYIANGRYLYYSTEPPVQGQAGSITIDYPASSTTTSSFSPGNGPTQLPEVLLVSGAVLMLLAVALWPRGQGRTTTTEKQV